jgi:hypothetical protein
MIFVYILLAYGITNIVVFSTLFEPLRDLLGKSSFLDKLINCPMCFSTWVGFGLSTLLILTANITPVGMFFTLPVLLTIFLDGCFTSGCVWLLYILEEYFTKEEQ